MPATFLQQCDHALGNTTRDGFPGQNQWLKHIRQNRHKTCATSSSTLCRANHLVPGDLLRPTCFNASRDFAFSNHTLATSRFSCPKVGEVGEIAVKTLGVGDQCSGQSDNESAPEKASHISRLAAVAHPGSWQNQYTDLETFALLHTQSCFDFTAFVEKLSLT